MTELLRPRRWLLNLCPHPHAVAVNHGAAILIPLVLACLDTAPNGDSALRCVLHDGTINIYQWRPLLNEAFCLSSVDAKASANRADLSGTLTLLFKETLGFAVLLAVILATVLITRLLLLVVVIVAAFVVRLLATVVADTRRGADVVDVTGGLLHLLRVYPSKDAADFCVELLLVVLPGVVLPQSLLYYFPKFHR